MLSHDGLGEDNLNSIVAGPNSAISLSVCILCSRSSAVSNLGTLIFLLSSSSLSFSSFSLQETQQVQKDTCTQQCYGLFKGLNRLPLLFLLLNDLFLQYIDGFLHFVFMPVSHKVLVLLPAIVECREHSRLQGIHTHWSFQSKAY